MKLEHTLFNCNENTIKQLVNHFSLVSIVTKIDILPNDSSIGVKDIILHVPDDIDPQRLFSLGILMGAFDFKNK